VEGGVCTPVRPLAILYHEVPNLSITIRNFFIAGGGTRVEGGVCTPVRPLAILYHEVPNLS
jgi:hypothetical protein